MRDDVKHARQPNTLVVGFCLDCGPLEDVGGNMLPAGAKRYLTETGHCGTCGSKQTLIPNAVRELESRKAATAREASRVQRRRRARGK